MKSKSTSSNYSPTSSPTPENPHLNETVVVKYRVGGDARPHSIDEQIYGELKERTVWGEDLIHKNGHWYYNMIIGHGDTVDLLVE